MNCKICGNQMKALFTSMYCDCEGLNKKSGIKVSPIRPDGSVTIEFPYKPPSITNGSSIGLGYSTVVAYDPQSDKKFLTCKYTLPEDNDLKIDSNKKFDLEPPKNDTYSFDINYLTDPNQKWFTGFADTKESPITEEDLEEVAETAIGRVPIMVDGKKMYMNAHEAADYITDLLRKQLESIFCKAVNGDDLDDKIIE